MSGLAALAACHYLPEMREKIFTVLYKAINSTAKELQDAGKEAMKKVRWGEGGEGGGGCVSVEGGAVEWLQVYQQPSRMVQFLYIILYMYLFILS